MIIEIIKIKKSYSINVKSPHSFYQVTNDKNVKVIC